MASRPVRLLAVAVAVELVLSGAALAQRAGNGRERRAFVRAAGPTASTTTPPGSVPSPSSTVAGASPERTPTTTRSATTTVPRPRPAPARLPAPSVAPMLGVYRGAANERGVHDFETWLGQPVRAAEDFLPADNWSTVEGPSWMLSTWRDSGRHLILSVPLLTSSSDSLRAGAAGDYDNHFRRLAENLVANGLADTTLRLGWEFNGSWFRWKAKDCPSCFAGYWRHVVVAMRAVRGAAFTFDWNPTRGREDFPAEDAWPGDDFVDYVGLDVYDQSSTSASDANGRWSDLVDGDHGLRWQHDFAAAHHKATSLPEWGVVAGADGGAGDDPTYIQHMHDWMVANGVAYDSYFAFDAPDGDHDLTDGKFPSSAARFRSLFGPPGR